MRNGSRPARCTAALYFDLDAKLALLAESSQWAQSYLAQPNTWQNIFQRATIHDYFLSPGVKTDTRNGSLATAGSGEVLLGGQIVFASSVGRFLP